MPDCGKCRGPASAVLRPLWGCDGPACHAGEPVDVFDVTCSWCLNVPEKRAQCLECKGTGAINHNRCPMALLRENEDGDAVQMWMRTYALFDQRGVLPDDGGWEDQSALFVRFVHIVDHERSQWEGEVSRYEREVKAAMR